MATLLSECRLAARVLLRSPGFTAVAVATLALGIGANTTVFSVVNAVLLRPLPFEESGRLVVLSEGDAQIVGRGTNVSYPNVIDWTRQQRSFEQIAALQSTSVVVRGTGEPVRVGAALVTSPFFDVLRVDAALGRTLLESDDRVGAEPTAVISHGLWQRRFGSNPAILGATISLDDQAHAVIGVMPPDFEFPDPEVDLWLSLGRVSDREPFAIRRAHVLTSIARLEDEVTLDTAQTEMDVIAARLQETYAGDDPGHGIRVTPLLDVVVEDARLGLLVLLGGVGFVLLIACLNIANLLIARAADRRRELALRRAIGATRWHLVRQILIESLLLAACGGGLALLVADGLRTLLVTRIADFVPRTTEIASDWRVLAFTGIVALVTGVLFGLAPLFLALRIDVNRSLKDGCRSDLGHGSNRLRYGLVAAEIGVSLLLLVGAGLMMKSFWRVVAVDPGFRSERLLTLTTSLPPSSYREIPPIVSFYGQLPKRLEALPGVESVSAVNALPLRGGDSYGELAIEGRPFPEGEAPETSFRRILPNYFRTMGIPLIAGREFDARDASDAPRVVIISDAIARNYFPNGDAVGTRIKVGPSDNEPWLTIVGVVADVRNVGLEATPRLATYEVHAQRPWTTMNVVVRTTDEPAPLIATVRQSLLDAEPELVVGNIATMTDRISTSLAPRRLLTSLLTVFATLAVLLAALGVYGVIAYVVTQRTHELGVRSAIGASSGDLIRLVVVQGLRVAAIGFVVGLASAVTLSLALEDLLFEVSATDPATLAVVSVLLLAVAVVASYVPARRVARLDPMAALRGD